MNVNEKIEIIKHITLGTNEVLYYPYAGGKEPLPLRPISSFELDQCIYKALRFAPEKISELVIKLKLKMIEPTRIIDVSDSGYAQLQAYYDSIDYWIVFYAMKDFQDEWFQRLDFSKENIYPKGFYQILKMNEVHEIADFILNSSYQNKEVIQEVFKDEVGKEVAYMYFYLKVPLTDIKSMTKLQRDYLLNARGELDKISLGRRKEKGYIISGQKMTVKDFLDKMGVSY